MSRYALLLASLLPLGCLHEHGLNYDRLTIEARRDDGTVVSSYPKCFTMPVLHGSVVDERHAIEGGVAIEIHATDAVIEVSFQGVTDPGSLARSITLDALQAGFTDTLPLAATSGAQFTVKLAQGCR